VVRYKKRSCVKAKFRKRKIERKRKERDREERIIILAFDIIRNFWIHGLIIEWMLMLLKILVMMLMLMMSVVAITASA